VLNLANANPLLALSSLFYPASCVVCSGTVAWREYLCADCRTRAPRIAAPFCAKCSEPFSGAITQTFSCANCEHRTLHFDCAVAAYRSRGLVRKLVHEFKYGRQRQLRHPLAAWLGETMRDARLRGRRFDVIVPVPLHRARERERGFNQALLLAELLSRRAAARSPRADSLHHYANRLRSLRADGKFARCLSFTKKDARARVARAPD